MSAEKISKLREAFGKHEIDGFLITSAHNRRYMTGFTGTAGVVLISKDRALMITDFRYVEQAKEQAKDYEIVQHRGPLVEEIGTQLQKLGIERLGFEQDHITYSTYRTYEQKFQSALVPLSLLIEEMRMTKDQKEIATIRKAVEIADQAFRHIVQVIRPGMKEIEVANELEFFMRKSGATSSSFDIIVASGWRSALPHGVASEKTIENGELVTLDFGALYDGYCSDLTRTVAVGEVSSELRKIYDIVLEAQETALEKIRPGITGKEADDIARKVIAEHGYGEAFGHSLGHGIGLEVHEGPGLSQQSPVVLQPGMVVTVEPGIYVPGLGGVRIEDDVLLTEDGCHILTKADKKFMVIHA